MADSLEIVKPQIDQSWLKELEEEFQSSYFLKLKQFLIEEKSKNTVYPPSKLIFNAFDSCPIEEVKVVILGQDPYHGKGQAHGLSFSVPENIIIPPSLKNIYKELKNDLGLEMPSHGNLERWAKHGVLLLNATLTVRAGQAGSHQNHGWEQFTDAAIKAVSNKKDHVVFMLWGNYAKAKAALIDQSKHLVLMAAHPSPFSAHSGFFGCKHFSMCNEYLIKHGLGPVDWAV